MGIFGTGLARLLQVGGALSRGPQADRMQLPQDGFRRARWNRDDEGMFQWTTLPRRHAFGMKDVGHAVERSSTRSPA
jgi:hypothetical protein